MRPLAIACGLLLAACSTAPARAALPEAGAPTARVPYADLNLRDSQDRDRLVARVAEAARDYCRTHADTVVPAHRRGDTNYCRASMRIQLVSAMPAQVRHAYDSGWRRRP
jgi:UrcA family protein